jgi:hypothetical protein
MIWTVPLRLSAPRRRTRGERAHLTVPTAARPNRLFTLTCTARWNEPCCASDDVGVSIRPSASTPSTGASGFRGGAAGYKGCPIYLDADEGGWK